MKRNLERILRLKSKKKQFKTVGPPKNFQIYIIYSYFVVVLFSKKKEKIIVNPRIKLLRRSFKKVGCEIGSGLKFLNLHVCTFCTRNI